MSLEEKSILCSVAEIRLRSCLVVYYNPKDFPGKWVIRRWYNGNIAETVPMAVSDTLEDAIKVIPKGWVDVGPTVLDDPVIHQIWCHSDFAAEIEEMYCFSGVQKRSTDTGGRSTQ